MPKMFYPQPGDIIVCNNGERYTCVNEKDYPYSSVYPNKAIYGVYVHGKRQDHMNWDDNSGVESDSHAFSIKEVIPRNPNRHVHADLIIAWANGAEIEYLNPCGEWMKAASPAWNADTEYRIKPKKKPNVIKYVQVNLNQATIWSDNPEDFHNLKITFDGETGKPISVELIGD